MFFCLAERKIIMYLETSQILYSWSNLLILYKQFSLVGEGHINQLNNFLLIYSAISEFPHPFNFYQIAVAQHLIFKFSFSSNIAYYLILYMLFYSLYVILSIFKQNPFNQTTNSLRFLFNCEITVFHIIICLSKCI